MFVSGCNFLSATTTKRLRARHARSWRGEVAASGLSLMPLSQACWWQGIVINLSPSSPQRPRDPFSEWPDRAPPHRQSLTQANGKCSHQAAISVTLLKERFPAERLLSDPIQHVSIYLWPDRLHEVARQAVAGGRVQVNKPKTRIEPKRGCCEPSLRFKERVDIIQHCISGAHRQPRRPG